MPGKVPRCVLLVEDNIIVALDTEEHLLSLGVVTVNLASSSGAALASLKLNIPDFAVLDFNLGEETSEPIADVLELCGVPFVFATGYHEVSAMIARYPHSLGVLHKPYSREDLAGILAQSGPAKSATLKFPVEFEQIFGNAQRRGGNARFVEEHP